MRIRVVTFALKVPAQNYVREATNLAPYGGVYVFESRADAERSRETDLLRGMFQSPAREDVTVREYDLLDAPTAITAHVLQAAGRGVA